MQKNVQSISSIDLSKGTIGESQIIKIEMFCEAPSEVPASQHQMSAREYAGI